MGDASGIIEVVRPENTPILNSWHEIRGALLGRATVLASPIIADPTFSEVEYRARTRSLWLDLRTEPNLDSVQTEGKNAYFQGVLTALKALEQAQENPDGVKATTKYQVGIALDDVARMIAKANTPIDGNVPFLAGMANIPVGVNSLLRDHSDLKPAFQLIRYVAETLNQERRKPNSNFSPLERRAAIVSTMVGFAQESSAQKLIGKTELEREKYFSAVRTHVFNTFSTVGEADPVKFLGAQKATQYFHVNLVGRK